MRAALRRGLSRLRFNSQAAGDTKTQRPTAAASAVRPSLESAICTCALTRRFGDLVAVENVSLRIRRGEIFGLIGSNGAGKSTLIKMLTTLVPPSSGAARVASFDVMTQAARVRQSIGYVPQMLSADRALTGYENLLLSARLYVIPRRERDQRIAEMLAMMNLTRDANRLVQHYSGGMIRELEIAQSILHRPEVLLMDEPTVGLDPLARRAVHERLRLLRERFGMSLFITTHDMSEANEMCERIALMHKGRIVVVGSPAELKAQVGPGSTLEDVFGYFIDGGIAAEDGCKEARRARQSARERS
jgi:ABC-2 type transport system ATP-binding protein